MPKCLRCGAEWLQGTVKQQPAECQDCIDKDMKINKLSEALKNLLKQYCDTRDVIDQPNHMVYGWHMNGDGQSVTSFFEDNDLGAVEEAKIVLEDME